MDFGILQTTVLAIIQGVTEFLPISSSAHLLLPTLLLGWPDQGLKFDVAVHVGSLSAVIIYFWQDLQRLLKAWLLSVVTRTASTESRLAWLLLLASIPAGIAGLAFDNLVEDYARAVGVIATTSILFGGLLYWADIRGSKNTDVDMLTWRSALLIGCAQMLALIPGTSRSGVTMMAALMCGLTREAAARFSFLLSIPIILATGLLKGTELAATSLTTADWWMLIYAIVLSGLVAYACIHFFLKMIERIGFLPFVIYRIVLGLVLFGILFAG